MQDLQGELPNKTQWVATFLARKKLKVKGM